MLYIYNEQQRGGVIMNRRRQTGTGVPMLREPKTGGKNEVLLLGRLASMRSSGAYRGSGKLK
jgi:hypothetical protein